MKSTKKKKKKKEEGKKVGCELRREKTQKKLQEAALYRKG